MSSTIERTHVLEAIEAVRPAIERICSEVWDLAELSLAEVESAKVHIRELEAAGFTVESGTAGVRTAFVAERRFGDGPVVGFLSEYDALPGLGTRPQSPSGARRLGQAQSLGWMSASSTRTIGRYSSSHYSI